MSASSCICMTSRPCVLVIEDQSRLAEMIESELRELGLDVVGPTSSLAEAEELARRYRLSAAVIDLQLDPPKSESLARQLRQRGCQVLFISMHGFDGAPADLKDRDWIQIPFSHEELALAIRQLVPTDIQCRPGGCPCLS